MSRLNFIEPVFVENIPDDLDEGKLYVSEKYECAIHLCACGCRQKAVTPLKNRWTLTKNGDRVSLYPSIGNFSGENPHHAHYFITDNKIQWV